MVKTAKELNVEGKIDNNYLTEHFIADPVKDGETPDWEYLADGIEGADPKAEDKKNTKAYLNTGGQERTTVTGVSKSRDFSGDRSVGNPAQDKIARMEDKTGSGRITLMRVNNYSLLDDGTLALTDSEEGNVTWSDFSIGTGNANDARGFKATASYNAKPKRLYADDSDDVEELKKVLEETPSINAYLAGTTASVAGVTGGTGEGNTPS